MPGVYRYIGYRVGDPVLTEDLTAAVFEKALAAFPRYRQEKASPMTWLMAIARNVVVDHLRRLGRDLTVPLELAEQLACPRPNPGEAVERGEEVARLRYCLSRLAGRDREIISLKFGAELNNRMIAAALSLSETNVGAIVFRALRKLRDCLMEWLNEYTGR
jgi:RNA polymerase sigma-70 factor (ECF subfamily)